MKTLLGLFSIILVVSLVLAQDPCSSITSNVGQSWFGPLPPLQSCFNGVKANKAQAVSTIEAVKRTIDLYSFSDIAAISGPPYDINVDLRGGIRQIEAWVNSSGFISDYEFHSKIMDLLNPLNDAHTLYRAPEGYNCYLIKPFNLEATYSLKDKSMHYFLRTGPLQAAGKNLWQSIFGQSLDAAIDQEVISINGKPVTEYLKLFVNNFISTYKDPAVRFNAALRNRFSQVILSQFHLNGKHVTSLDTFMLSNGKEYAFNNAGFCPNSIGSLHELESRNRYQGSLFDSGKTVEEIIMQTKRDFLQGIDIHMELEEEWQQALKTAGLYADVHKRDTTTLDETEEFNRIMLSRQDQGVKIHHYGDIHRAMGAEFHQVTPRLERTTELPITKFNPAYLKLQSQTPSADTTFLLYSEPGKEPFYILRLTTFAPEDEAATLTVVNDLFSHAKQTNGKNLIVDVAYNGGGLVCLADLLIAVLAPEFGDLRPPEPGKPTPFGLYDFRQSATTEAIRRSPILNNIFTSPNNYLSPSTMRKWGNDSFFNPKMYSRGRLSSPYTQIGYFPADCVGYPGTWTPVKYHFTKVVILTDGTCGSACALFTSQLQANNLATVVSYGGYIPNPVPLSTASFAGGNVLEYRTIASFAAAYDPRNDRLPKKLDSSGRLRFNFNEYYEPGEFEVPREFLKRPAHIHIDFFATLFNDDNATPLGIANSAALYGSVAAAVESAHQ